MRVDLVKDEKEFGLLEEAWNPLLSRSGTSNIFLTFEWLSTWWKHFGDRHELSIVVVRSGGRIVALFPLMKTAREGFRQLGLISNKMVDYKDFIIEASQDRAKVIRSMLDALVESGGWDLLLLNGYPEDSANFGAFRAALPGFGGRRVVWRDAEVALSVPLEGSYERYLQSLGKSIRRNVSDAQKRLAKDGRRVRYQSDVDEERLEGLIDKIIDLNAIRWKDVKNQYSAFEDPAIREFYKDLARRLLPTGGLDLTVMYIDDEIGSMSLGFRHGRSYFGLINTYDGRFGRYSLGYLQILHIIRKAFEDGIAELDLLSGGEPYKYQFKPRERRMHTVGLFGPGPKASLAYLWFFGIRPWLERMEGTPVKRWYWWYRQRSVRRG